MQNIIKWFLSLFKKHEVKPQVDVTPVKATKDKFPVAKGYVIRTREGGVLNCLSQKDVADTLATLYSLPINRDNVHYALRKYNGRLTYKGEYIATIKYRKEN